jgi:pSer/pThr/pTyr-binding forkhead associated (FHA) protein
MSAAAPLLSTTMARITLTVQTGPEKGVTFQLLPPSVTIGRGADNDIALTDPKCSRRQAVVHLMPQGLQLEDTSGRQTTLINGHPIVEPSLKNDDLIQIGETTLLLKIELPTPPAALLAVPNFNTGISISSRTGFSLNSQITPPPRDTMGVQSPFNSTTNIGFQIGPKASERLRVTPTENGKQNRVRFYAIIGILGLAAFWFIGGSGKMKVKDPGIRSSQDVETDIKNADERLENLAQAKKFKSAEEEIRYQEAHRHYLDGFRDYQNGQYSIAMRSFETALAIDPDHALARHYHEIAARRRDEIIAASLQDGKIYRDRQMFTRCSATLQKVLFEVANPEDLRFKEAQALKRECDLIQQRKD